MKLEPIITEETTKLAQEGKYTFRVGIGLNKFQIKKLIEWVFGVHVVNVHTLKTGGEVKKTAQGRKRKIKALKKAIVVLKEKEKIDLFETKKSK